MFPSQARKQKKGLLKVYDKIVEHYFLYIPNRILLLKQGNVAHAGGFCLGQTSLKQEINHHLHLYYCINLAAK